MKSCVNGHLLTEENKYNFKGKVVCKKCKSNWNKKWLKKIKKKRKTKSEYVSMLIKRNKAIDADDLLIKVNKKYPEITKARLTRLVSFIKTKDGSIISWGQGQYRYIGE